MKVVSMFLVLFVTLSIHGQSRSDEARVIEATLNHVFEFSLPYVKRWVLASTTERLEPGSRDTWSVTWFDGAREDYLSRNSVAVQTADLELSDHVIVSDLSRFSKDGKFDWTAFEKEYPGGETWTARVSRPGFSDDSHAVVRLDVWNSVLRGIGTTVVHLERSDGQWRVVGSQTPAYRPVQ